eukprot:TRINITY_DN9230_c0_g1_i1.p1 TRINITY_DN9230_c0_g1~~TRINITY_DN9230_c0_g1_i1.p1  ORF type:complete len:554 (+),score=158.88 TRINITY_DN9230_c0_g1_i1:134-1663(+)
MDPAMMSQMAANAGMPNISTEQARQAREQMGKMNDSDFQQQMGRATQQQAYLEAGAESLKSEGNAFFKAEQYRQAVDKYEKAIDNLKMNMTEKSATITQACRLNLSLCYIRLNEPAKAVPLCDKVLEKGANLKAHYRRGLAYEALEQYDESLVDLKAALAMSPNDATMQQAVERVQGHTRPLIEEIVDGQDASPESTAPAAVSVSSSITADESNTPPPQETRTSSTETIDQNKPSHASTDGPVIEEIDDDAKSSTSAKDSSTTASATTTSTAAARQTSTTSATTAANMPPGMPAVPPEMMEAMKDPATVRMMKQMAASQSDDALRAQCEAMGVPFEQAKMSQTMLSNMDDETFASMVAMQSQMMGNQPQPSPNSTPASRTSPSDAPKTATPAGAAPTPNMADMAKMMDDPKMMKMMSDMLNKMPPEQLAEVMSAQTGTKMTPEQAKQVQDKLASLTPEQMAMLTKTSAKLQQGWQYIKTVFSWFFGTPLRATVSTLAITLLLNAVFDIL